MSDLLFGDEAIRWVQQAIGLGHPIPFQILSLLGDTWGMILVAGVALWLFGRERLYAVVGIVVAGALTKLLLNRLVHQTRPEGPGIVVYEQLQTSSFPSGHVYEAVGPWGLLYALGCVPLWLAAAVAVGVSLGRMYLGTHYLGDVLGGIVLAVPLVWIFVRAWPSVRGWLGRRSRGFHQAAVAVVLAGTAGWLLFGSGTPRRYEIAGMAAAGAVALLVVVGREGAPPEEGASPARAALQVLLGTAGIACLVALDRLAPEEARLLGTLTAGAATLWALIGAPQLTRRLEGAGRRRDGAVGRASTSEPGGGGCGTGS